MLRRTGCRALEPSQRPAKPDPPGLGDTHRAMSEESTTPDLVELTRGYFEAASRRDLDAVMSFFAPDAVWETVSLGTNFEGVAAIRNFFEDWVGAYEEFEMEMEMEEALDLGNGV